MFIHIYCIYKSKDSNQIKNQEGYTFKIVFYKQLIFLIRTIKHDFQLLVYEQIKTDCPAGMSTLNKGCVARNKNRIRT